MAGLVGGSRQSGLCKSKRDAANRSDEREDRPGLFKAGQISNILFAKRKHQRASAWLRLLMELTAETERLTSQGGQTRIISSILRSKLADHS